MDIKLITDILQVITLVFGVIYVTMQIFQHKWMWYVNIISSSGALAIGIMENLWANTILSTYFLVMDFVGIAQWRKIERRADREAPKEKTIHIVRPRKWELFLTSVPVLIVGGGLCFWIFSQTNDPNPLVDSLAFIMSMIATYWLTRSFIQEWQMWICANIAQIILFGGEKLWGMALLYVFYIISCVIGYFHWKKHGVVVNSKDGQD